MHDLGYPVHKRHDVRLQNLGCRAEVADAAGANDALDPLPLDHGIDVCTVNAVHVVHDDVRPSLAKSECQQRSQLDDRPLQDDGLHDILGARRPREAGDGVPDLLEPVFLHVLRLPLLQGPRHLLHAELLVGDLHRKERVLADGFHLEHHALQVLQHQAVRVVGDEVRGHGQRGAHEDRQQQRVEAVTFHIRPEVEIKGKVPVLEGSDADVQPRRVLPPLHAAEVLGARDHAVHLVGDLLAQQRDAQAVVPAVGRCAGRVPVQA
mmetsp:Transcript_40845/g.116549  ORF Transcript_40845/g.116549 Transcript_40845/m.116549 type:complete len:264 (+) Transcript_40845:393-1184(+)